MTFYMFWYGLIKDSIIIADVIDPRTLGLSSLSPTCLLTFYDMFTEGDGRFPAAMEAEFKQSIRDHGYWLGGQLRDLPDRRPRFFTFAPRERWQDAFVSWLIEWAEDQYSEINEPLHRTGALFLNRLLDLHELPSPKCYEYVRTTTPYTYQNKNQGIDIRIDILVKVNSDIVVLIEDKIKHNLRNPLEVYLNFIQERFENPIPVPVYLKTGDPKIGDKTDEKAVEEAGWRCFVRRDMLDVLKNGILEQGVQNDTFRDFYYRLSREEHIFHVKRTKHAFGAGTGFSPRHL
jgi:hypothetical protein